ncbi:MAG: hypothetical protein LC723_12915 [Actinobacteria bacterium]|nr:hypothetical protein [Actinomycetota bacterium]
MTNLIDLAAPSFLKCRTGIPDRISVPSSAKPIGKLMSEYEADLLELMNDALGG